MATFPDERKAGILALGFKKVFISVLFEPFSNLPMVFTWIEPFGTLSPEAVALSKSQ